MGVFLLILINLSLPVRKRKLGRGLTKHELV